MSSISSIFTILEMCVYHLFVTSLHIPCLRFKTKNIKKLTKRYSGIYVEPLLPLLPLMEKKMWTVLFQETAIEKEKKERRGKIQEAGKTEGKKRKKLMHSNVMVSEQTFCTNMAAILIK